MESILALLELEFEIIATVADGGSLIQPAKIFAPSLIHSDISMHLLGGLEAACNVLKINPQMRIIFLTIHNNPTLAKQGLFIGALGYVLKSRAALELRPAIYEVM